MFLLRVLQRAAAKQPPPDTSAPFFHNLLFPRFSFQLGPFSGAKSKRNVFLKEASEELIDNLDTHVVKINEGCEFVLVKLSQTLR